MQRISTSDLSKIYFNTAPSLLGELFTAIGLFIFIYSYPLNGIFVGLGFLVIGLYFVQKKIVSMNVGRKALTTGTRTTAKITDIQRTNTRSNSRRVKDYKFEYEVGDEEFEYHFKSAKHRELEIGNRFAIFYMPNDPKTAIIPELYSLEIRE